MLKRVIAVVLVVTVVASSPSHKIGLNYHSERIVRDSDAVDGQYPYHAAFLRKVGGLCGASIVDHEWVVTAANCAKYNPGKDMVIYAGSVKLNSGGTKYAIKEIYFNEYVAILKVDYITYTDKIRPIILDTEDVADNEPCVVTGWNETRLYQHNLQYFNVSTITHETCSDYEICALPEMRKRPCYGNVGSPLVREVNGVARQIGILSWLGSCDGDVPNRYFKVSRFIDWFREHCNNCI